MNIINQYKNKKIEKIVDYPVNLALSNNLGNFFYLTNQDETRYQGFFHASFNSANKKPDIYKIIDKIDIIGDKKISEFKNGFSKLERTYEDGLVEGYFMPEDTNSLCLNMSRNTEAEITLDIRSPYDSRSMGRFYTIKSENDCLLIKFVKRRDWQEDHLGDKKEFSLFLAVKTDKESFTKIEKFIEKYYNKDHKRSSYPWNRFVFKAFRMNFKKAVFSVNKNKKKALSEAEDIFENFEGLYKETKSKYEDLNISKITDPEIKMAHLCAQNSIRSLLVTEENEGAYAGIPWFFQFWHRDEAIALPQIYKLNKEVAKKIINEHLDIVLKGEGFPKRRFSEEKQEVQCADSVGILARSCQQIFEDDKKDIDIDFKYEIIKKFEKVVPKLLQERTEDDLAKSYKNETWMDSLDREGYRVEIQTGRLALYKLLLIETNNEQYKILLEDMEKKVVEKFYRDQILWDSPEDSKIRPNVFLSYYLYPELLTKDKWEKCFDKILPELYLEWGGISSLSQTEQDFNSNDTGENSTAYHNGDSWYWINNLTALALFKLNPSKYSEYINEIMESSTNEILYMGTIGHHSEVSSADKQESNGCEVQLWSSATYLDFFDNALKK